MRVMRNVERPLALIAGVGTCLPTLTIESTAIEEDIRASGVPIACGFIERATGVRARHAISPGENASDLAAAASLSALRAAGKTPADVDVIIFAAASHDVTEPATANIVQIKI